jgi:hypothetical protein
VEERRLDRILRVLPPTQAREAVAEYALRMSLVQSLCGSRVDDQLEGLEAGGATR